MTATIRTVAIVLALLAAVIIGRYAGYGVPTYASSPAVAPTVYVAPTAYVAPTPVSTAKASAPRRHRIF